MGDQGFAEEEKLHSCSDKLGSSAGKALSLSCVRAPKRVSRTPTQDNLSPQLCSCAARLANHLAGMENLAGPHGKDIVFIV